MKPKKDITAPARARLQHSDENTSDYVEVIADLIKDHGEARPVDIARRLGVSRATVTKKVQQLQREGLVKTQPYRSVFLEPAGATMALDSKHRHSVVLEFLLALGIPAAVAEIDAEGIEHHVSPETVDALDRLTGTLGKPIRKQA